MLKYYDQDEYGQGWDFYNIWKKEQSKNKILLLNQKEWQYFISFNFKYGYVSMLMTLFHKSFLLGMLNQWTE